MGSLVREFGYSVAIILGTALAVSATMLGLFFTPLVATGVASGLVVVSAVALVPREHWVGAGTLGVGTVVLAGTLVPRVAVAFAARGPVMALTLGVDVVIVGAVIMALHYLTFHPWAA